MTAEYLEHYQTLGLRPDASKEDIKRAYFRLVRKYSPEKEPEQFQKIRRAYEALQENGAEGSAAFSPPADPAAMACWKDAVQWVQEGEPKRAAEVLSEALKMFPEDPFFLLNLAQAQRAAGNPRKAAKTAEQLGKIAPDCKEAHAIAGAACYEGGWYKKALPEFRKAYALGMRTLEFLCDYVDVAGANHMEQEAEQICRETLETVKWDKTNIDAALNLYEGTPASVREDPDRLNRFLDEYEAFLKKHRRSLGSQDLDALLNPFLSVCGALKSGSEALSYPGVYHRLDGLVLLSQEVAGGEDAVVYCLRMALLSDALQADTRFDDSYWHLYAIALALPVEFADEQTRRFAQLEAELFLLKEAEENRKQIPAIQADYPLLYEHRKDLIDCLASGNVEGLYARRKREHARLVPKFEGSDFLDRYPEERERPVPVTVYDSPEPYVRPNRKVGRNDPCPCGSGLKFKRCCLGKGIYD